MPHHSVCIYQAIKLLLIMGKWIHLSGVDSLVDDLEDEVCPDDVEDEEGGEERVEDVVRGEHLNDLRRLDCRAMEIQ